MKIGVLSDTHNNTANLEKALDAFRKAGIEVLFHCGDVTSPETACRLAGYTVHLTFGNGDMASGEIAQALKDLDSDNSAGMVYTGTVDGARIAATHGHLRGKVDELARSGEYDYVFHGHSHRRKNERILATRVINPGALGGLRAGSRSAVILDLDLGEASFIEFD